MNEKELYEECHRLFSYNPETGLLTRKINSGIAKAGNAVGGVDSKGYLKLTLKSKYYGVHRIAWLMVYGAFPKAFIDHINGNPLDNRLCNLRDVTSSQNQQNRGRQSNNTTGFKGVCVDISKRINQYKARIHLNGRVIHLGLYSTPELAHKAYCAAVEKHHGEFGRFA